MDSLKAYDEDSSSSSSSSSSDGEAARRRSRTGSLLAASRAPLRLPNPLAAGESSPSSSALQEIGENGKVRQFPHVKGNWATHVYLRVSLESEDLMGLCLSSARWLERRNPSSAIRFLWDDGSLDSSLHVSLSRPFPLRMHLVASLVEQLTQSLTSKAAPSRFALSFQDFSVFSNDDRTRHFLVLFVRQGAGAVRQLIEATDAVFRKFGLPEYYKDPIPHASFAYSMQPLKNADGSSEDVGTFPVDSVEIKVGNQHFRVRLKE